MGRPATDLVERVLAGQPAGIARMISRAERRAEGVDEELGQLHEARAGAYVVGVTGPSGSGKSTLVARVAGEFGDRGHAVGVLAIDPSSPYSGGSILGDRIRMLDLADNPKVFVRSMATRGSLGGLARATSDAVTVLAAGGMDVIVVETVGVGQDEVDIVRTAHSVVVVSVPGLGDDVQALKAGLLEIADVHVVNKYDLPGAARTVAELREALRLGPPGAWRVPVHGTSARDGTGVSELVDHLLRHRAWLEETGEGERRERHALGHRIKTYAIDELLSRLERASSTRRFAELVDQCMRGERDPRSAARELAEQYV